ncbi:DNA-directed RNA polymerase II subunit RPB11-like protein [Neoconidiobolus thromboides FSU 785]|nr:DNA-directed RNA polymerase II subunit RPB11-like protein [Neoconidiobolus thromboides FSU 785]
MNAPDRFESFILPDGAKKLEAVKTISGVKNSMIFRIEREDHTLGNMIRTELHKNPKVIFSGYKIPHPLQHHLEIYIQTQDGYKPATALNEALSTLISDIAKMRSNFDVSFTNFTKKHFF